MSEYRDPMQGVEFTPEPVAITAIRCASCGVVQVGPAATAFVASGLCPVCTTVTQPAAVCAGPP